MQKKCPHLSACGWIDEAGFGSWVLLIWCHSCHVLGRSVGFEGRKLLWGGAVQTWVEQRRTWAQVCGGTDNQGVDTWTERHFCGNALPETLVSIPLSFPSEGQGRWLKRALGVGDQVGRRPWG